MKIQVMIMSALMIMILALAAACGRTAPPISANETEATEFMGTKLTPINKQLNNALIGTQQIDKTTYRLGVDGLVERPLSLSFDYLVRYHRRIVIVFAHCLGNMVNDYIAHLDIFRIKTLDRHETAGC